MSTPTITRISDIDVTMFASVDDAAEHVMAERLHGFNNAIAINPEKIVRMRLDGSLLRASKTASINYPDGIGVCIVLGRRTGQKVTRIPGVELWERLIRRSVEYQTPVFILGGSADVNAKTVERLKGDLGVNVVGHRDGFFESRDEVIQSIRDSGAQIISVAMGSPKQELFIEQCRQAGLTGFFMGVGGTYDVFCGATERAPAAFRNLGLEWLYRLLRQPSRIFRQKNLLTFVALYVRGKL